MRPLCYPNAAACVCCWVCVAPSRGCCTGVLLATLPVRQPAAIMPPGEDLSAVFDGAGMLPNDIPLQLPTIVGGMGTSSRGPPPTGGMGREAAQGNDTGSGNSTSGFALTEHHGGLRHNSLPQKRLRWVLAAAHMLIISATYVCKTICLWHTSQQIYSLMTTVSAYPDVFGHVICVSGWS